MAKKILAVIMASILCLKLVGCIGAREAEETESERFMSGDYEYIVLEDDTAEIVGYSGSEESLIIPGELDGRVVTDIGDWAFSWCESLTSIEIPDSVSKIGTNPFMGCDNLREIYISPDSEYLAVIDGILYNKQDKGLVCYPCAKQELSFVIPSGIEVIGDYAFFVCSSLTSIEIPDTVTKIGDRAFSWCKSLTSIEIPDSVSKIGTNPFMGCDNLREIYISPDSEYLAVIDGILYNKQDKGLVCYPCAKQELSFVIPSGIEVIGDYAFFVCSSLTSIEIPDTVTKIGDSAFSWCESLTSIEIPDTVTSIGDWAFSWCESLTSIEIPDTVTSIGEGAFSGCDNLTLTVPRDSYVKQYCIDNGLKYTYADSLDWLTN